MAKYKDPEYLKKYYTYKRVDNLINRYNTEIKYKKFVSQSDVNPAWYRFLKQLIKKVAMISERDEVTFVILTKSPEWQEWQQKYTEMGLWDLVEKAIYKHE